MSKAATIHLTLWERSKLPELLPQQAKHETGRLCVQIRKKCEKRFTKAEEKKYKATYEDSPQGKVMRYDEKRDKGEDVHFNATEMFIIVTNARKVENEERLPTTEKWLTLYDKIIAAGGTEKNGKAKEEKKK